MRKSQGQVRLSWLLPGDQGALQPWDDDAYPFPEQSGEMREMVHSRPLWLKIGSRATHTLCVIYVPRICSHGDTLKQNSEMGKHMRETQLVKGSSELS